MIPISVSGKKKEIDTYIGDSNKEAFTSRVASRSYRIKEYTYVFTSVFTRDFYTAHRASYRARLSPTENSSACYSQSGDRLKYPSTGRASLFPAKAWTFKRARIDWKGQKLAALTVQIGAH